jgi:PIN domain nuclease of toxin-antitoxin system
VPPPAGRSADAPQADTQPTCDVGIEPLALDEEATLYSTRLPPLHRDPFDRMLVCQSIVSGMVLLTPDPGIAQYAVRSMW